MIRRRHYRRGGDCLRGRMRTDLVSSTQNSSYIDLPVYRYTRIEMHEESAMSWDELSPPLAAGSDRRLKRVLGAPAWVTEEGFWVVRSLQGRGRGWELWALAVPKMEVLVEGDLVGLRFATRRKALDALDEWIMRMDEVIARRAIEREPQRCDPSITAALQSVRWREVRVGDWMELLPE